MTRTQIQLPDDLYLRAKTFAAQREISLAEMTRRGLELFLARFPEKAPRKKGWKLPKLHSGTQVPLEDLRRIAAEDEEMRGRGER